MNKSRSAARSAFAAIALSIIAVPISLGASPASDNASDPAYASSFATGTNGGTGLGPWNIVINMTDTGAQGGSFINGGSNDQTNLPAPVFDIWNQNTVSGGGVLFEDVTTATRPFTGAMNPNQSFSFSDVLHFGNQTDGGGSFLGWSLQDSSGSNLLDFHTGGGLPGYYLTDENNSLALQSGIYYNYNAADKFVFTLNDSNGDYSLFVQGSNGSVVGGSQTLTGQIDMSTGGPAQFSIYDNNGGFSSDIQFNNLTISAPGVSNWTAAGSGDWNNNANWSGNIPNGVGNEADFFASITSPQTVYTNTPITLGTLHFNNTSNYVLAGAGSLTMEAAVGADALVQVDQGSQEINLPLTIASNTTFNVAANSQLTIADPLTVNSGLTVTQTGAGAVIYESTINLLSGASITMGNSTQASALTVGAGASVNLAAHALAGQIVSLTVGSLSLNGGKLDIANNNVLFAHGPFNANPVASVRSLLVSSYDNGAWNSSAGIVSSEVASHPGTTIGYVDGSTGVDVMYTWDGDTNLDGVVNSQDVTNMTSGNGSSWATGDLNYDGVKNADDWSLFDLGLALGSKNISGVVPEPGALALCSTAMILSAAGARRRR